MAGQYIISSLNNEPLPELYVGQKILINGPNNSSPHYVFHINDIVYVDSYQLMINITEQNRDIKDSIYDLVIFKTEEPVLRKVLGQR